MWAGLGGVVLLVVIGVLAIGVFGVHTAFIDDVVDEAGPVFDSGAAGDEPTTGDEMAPATGDDVDERVAEMADAPTTTAAATEIVTLAEGAFEGRGRYSSSGTAVVLGDGSEQRFLRFEDDFEVSNGPDLFVYLGTGSPDYFDADEWVDLGVLTGNIGSQNYEIPASHPSTGEPIDLDRFDHVAVWCRRFDSTFAIARLG